MVGAGIAGLKTAVDLANEGFNVTVLEARNQVGGRILTLNGPSDEPIELGASHWEGYEDNPLYQSYLSKTEAHKPIILKRDIVTSALYSIDPDRDENFGRLDHQLFKKLYQLSAELYDELIEHENDFSKSVEILFSEIQTKIEDVGLITPISQLLLKKLLYFQHVEQSTNPDLLGFYQKNVSYQTDPIYCAYEKYNKPDAIQTFVSNGFGKLPTALKQECREKGVKFIFNCEVQHFTQTESKVTVSSTKGSFHGDYVVCALPEGVIKKNLLNLFTPVLSKEKQAAFEALGIHQSKRIVLQFEKPFWAQDKGPFIFVNDKNLNRLVEIRNFYAINGQYTLHSDSYCGDTKEAVTEHMMTDLRKIYQNLPNPSAVYFQDWTQDPYSLGAYPYPSKNMTTRLQSILAEHAGRIYFAGVYTSPHGESVHHAYASGLRVATDIINQTQN